MMARWLLLLVAAGARACPEGTVPFPTTDGAVECEPALNATLDAVAFLRASLPPWDAMNAASLGFPGPDESGVDGLNYGVLQPTVNISLENRAQLGWAAAVPKDVWQDFVLPYASVNEARSNWRPLLRDALLPRLLNASGGAAGALNTTAVVAAVNAQLWSALTPSAITFRSSQTPLIYDPMSVLAFGYASCTGVSLLFVDALRSVGVAARLAGTPAWNGNATSGNHNWVEVFEPASGAWGFIEGKPAGGGETLADPCDKWFCSPAKAAGTQFFAAQWSRATNASIYPMAWDVANLDVPGVDRTAYYQQACGAC